MGIYFFTGRNVCGERVCLVKNTALYNTWSWRRRKLIVLDAYIIQLHLMISLNSYTRYSCTNHFLLENA